MKTGARRLTLLTATVLAGVFCDGSGHAASQSRGNHPAATGGSQVKAHGRVPVKIMHPRTSVNAQDAEAISVRVSRQALNGGGGMMRREIAPHSVQTVTKQYIEMQSPASTALDMIKNLQRATGSTADRPGILGGKTNRRSLKALGMGISVKGVPGAGA